MNTLMLKAVNEYQCPGCMHGPDAETCERSDVTEKGCTNQHAGLFGAGIGAIALGLPKGFNRFGPAGERKVEVWSSYEVLMECHPNLRTIFSLPVWKHLDDHGNTVTRWFSPRTNCGWSLVILGDCRDKFPQAIEITAAQIADMD
jgi:hypothetical protein